MFTCASILNSTLLVGLLILSVAFRACRGRWQKKLGAWVFWLFTLLLGYWVIGAWWGALLVSVIWLFLPWVELLSSTRHREFPVCTYLPKADFPSLAFFPYAEKALNAFEAEDFELAGSSSWVWDGMTMHWVSFWHPEECVLVNLALCEQADVAFSCLILKSKSKCGMSFHTTNFPYSSTLKSPPQLKINHLACVQRDFPEVLQEHRRFVQSHSINCKDLFMPDPEQVVFQAKAEMKEIIDYNFEKALIRPSHETHFRYTTKGLFFLWGRYLRDMIRLC